MKKINVLLTTAVVLLAGLSYWVFSAAGAPFTVLCYNVRHCEGMDGKLDVPRIARIIKARSPRFAALQEIDCGTRRVNGLDEAAELGRLTGMVPTFAKGIDYAGGAYGVMLLSRQKPLSVQRIALPGREPRVLLLAEFPDCYVGCTHLDVSLEAARKASVSLIAQALAKCRKPVFMTGDWNALPHSDVLCEMKRFVTILSETKTRTYHGKPEKGPSGGVDDFCIDYIALDRAHEADYAVKARGTVEERVASDHAPIFVTVERKGK